MMEFVLNILLNYITLGVAGVAFILLLVVLIWKRKNFSAKEKGLLSVLLIILALYFVFVIVVSIQLDLGILPGIQLLLPHRKSTDKSFPVG